MAGLIPESEEWLRPAGCEPAGRFFYPPGSGAAISHLHLWRGLWT
jgi:hypothetical protein